MNPNNQSQNTTLLDGICRRGVLVSTSVPYWRGCKRLNAEDLGLDPAHVSDRLIQLGHKRHIPRDALQAFALIESRVQATVESSSFPFLGGIGRFVPNPRLGDLTDKLDITPFLGTAPTVFQRNPTASGGFSRRLDKSMALPNNDRLGPQWSLGS